MNRTTPDFPAPIDVPLPAWATRAAEWEWDVEHWQRRVDAVLDERVEVATMQYAETSGVTVDDAVAFVDGVEGDNPDRLRSLAAALLAAAVALEAAQATEATA